jgi:hypothetical protein
MRGVHLLWTSILLVGFAMGLARADEFRLANGNVLRGKLADADEDGLVVKLDAGSFSKREPWVNFSQETLKELAKQRNLTPYLEPFIELDPEQLKEREKAKEITVKEVPTRLERPAEKTGLLVSFFTPVGLMILGVLLLANIYAGYEIALFRQQPVALVCGLSLLLPLLAPLVFIALPARAPQAAEGAGETEAAAVGSAGRKTTGLVPEKLSPGLSLAAADKRGSATPQLQPQTFNRGEHTFNRRFFETKFAGFFRIVPGEAEKDMVLVFRTIKQEYVGRRISRISSNDLHLQLLSNNQEAPISFAELTSVQMRHRDAKA